jgi:hypothetical protein
MVAIAKYGPRSRKHSAPIGRLASMATTPPASIPIQGEMPTSICKIVEV